jgi:hypothetical protein
MMTTWNGDQARAKQDAALDRWASAENLPFPTEEAKKAYQYRAGIIRDAVQLKKAPDRVPVYPIVTFAPIFMTGRNGRQSTDQTILRQGEVIQQVNPLRRSTGK